MTEVDLARLVVAHFRALAFTVYQEVRGPTGRVADLVAVRGRLVAVAEVKRTLGLAVIAQAAEWARFAHVVYVAALPGRETDLALLHLRRRVLAAEGLGLLAIRWEEEGIEEKAAPRWNRRADVGRWNLDPMQEHFSPAGSADGAAWSPWRRTSLEVLRFIAENPGRTTAEVVAGISHHYASDSLARSGILRWARRGGFGGVDLLPGAEVRVEAGKARWFYVKPGGADGR